MIRLIALAAIFWLLYRLILTLLNKASPPAARRTPPPGGNTMVRCAQCGLHIPQGEALEREGHYYCCAEHRDHDATDHQQRDE
jgi:uncharacterized protein